MERTESNPDKSPAYIQAGNMCADTKLAGYVRQMYDLLDGCFGNLNWWPGDSAFEVIVGAILTQNTAWRNVTLAIVKLKDAGILTPADLEEVESEYLENLIRSSGYYHVKARRLKAFSEFLRREYDGSLEKLAAEGLDDLRKKLLQVHGIGEETADSILLYACQKPVFVVDAYTKRILSRHAIVEETAGYSAIQNIFMINLPPSVSLYNQYHALLVNTGKLFCTTKKRCQECPLSKLAPYQA